MRAGGGASAIVCFLLASLPGTVSAHAQSVARVTSVKQMPDGMELSEGSMRIRMVALRDDVIRLRASHTQALPEDASWAVLPEARAAHVNVTADSDASSVGFHTAALGVRVDRVSGRMTLRDAKGHVLREDVLPLAFQDDGSFRFTERMPDDEHYFGLGDKPGPSDRRGRAFTMWNTDAYRWQESTDPLYKSMPFFLSFRAGEAMGTMLDNTWRTSFDFGKERRDAYSFGAENGPCDLYLFVGPTPREVVQTYAWLTGKPPLPPRWMLGFQQSRYTYTPSSRLMEIAERLRKDRIPADALYLDIDFQDRNRPFTVDSKTFGDLPEVLAKLKAMHFHTVAITDLHIAKVDQDYAPYASGMAADAFVHKPDGSVYVGSVWPGPAVFPDFTKASVRSWWGTLYKPFVAQGFAGFWNDMNEPSVFDGPQGTMPLDTVHRIDEPGFAKRTATHAEIHNVFGMENSRATYEGLLAVDPNARPFVLTRASYLGGQRYAATWTGDDSSTWNHLRMTTPMMKSLGLSGFSYTGADVGGFAGSSTSDLLTKWMEIAAFQPIDRDHSEKGSGDQEPWVGGEEAEAVRRRFVETRYRLMPYLYTLAEETARTGLPMVRPLFLDYPQATKDGHALDLDPNMDADFLLGHDLLIAPPPYPEAPDTYTVEFPTPEWYDFWTGAKLQSAPIAAVDPNAPVSPLVQVALSTKVKPALDSLPVYVRGGAILPMQPLMQSTDETPEGPLTLRVYVGDDCRGDLYTDDGSSFAFRKGQFLRMHATCSVKQDALTVAVSKHEGSYPAWWKQLRVEVYGWSSATHMAVDSNSKALQEETVANGVKVMLPDDGNGETITLR